jgi:hypothetical protein
MTSLKMAIEMFGLKSVDLVPSYLILAEASQGKSIDINIGKFRFINVKKSLGIGLGSFTQAQEYLSQAEWTVLKNPDCSVSIIAKLYRSIAMLQMAQELYDDALRNLANDVRI